MPHVTLVSQITGITVGAVIILSVMEHTGSHKHVKTSPQRELPVRKGRGIRLGRWVSRWPLARVEKGPALPRIGVALTQSDWDSIVETPPSQMTSDQWALLDPYREILKDMRHPDESIGTDGNGSGQSVGPIPSDRFGF